jgi:hypothetical protein
VRELAVAPAPARIGGSMTASLRLVNAGARPARAIVHLRVDFANTTRTHHPGRHRVAATVNGREAAATAIEVVAGG